MTKRMPYVRGFLALGSILLVSGMIIRPFLPGVTALPPFAAPGLLAFGFGLWSWWRGGKARA